MFSVTQVRWRDPKWRKSDRRRRSIVWLGDLSRGRIRDRANTIRVQVSVGIHLRYKGRRDTQQDCHRISNSCEAKEQAFVVEQLVLSV